MSTLHESILKAGELVDSRNPVDIYLDKVDREIKGIEVTWASWPKYGVSLSCAGEGWFYIGEIPPRAIPEVLVNTLLDIEDTLEEIANGDISDYELELNIPACYDPNDWFVPVISDLKKMWEEGMSAYEILDSVNLGNELEGMVDYDEALEWMKLQIEEWEEEKEDDEEEA